MFASGEAVPSRPGPDLDENFWNFVTELDAGLQSTIPLDLPELSCILSADIQQPEQNQNAPALCPNNNQQLTAVERRQEKNRLAQKRFRQRKKERSSTTEAQLAETTSQLHNLKLKQKELEARNALLEKLARLDKQHKIQQESPTNGCNVLLWQDDAEAVLSTIKEVMEGSAVVLTVHGYKQLMALEDFASWTAVQFAKLYTTYGANGKALLGQSAIVACRHNGLHAKPGKGPAAIETLAVWQNRAAVAGEQALLNRMSDAEQNAQLIMSQPVKLGIVTPVMRLESDQIAEQLHSNAMDDRKSYKTFSSAFFRGIQTSKQHAISMVHPYPFLMDATKQLEAFGSAP
ncbi:TPA: hypothetical protein ACH3X2_002313 [Trebouxia sp. C0005]